MSNRLIEVREWTCDVCGARDRTDAVSKDLMRGWTARVVQLADGTIGIDLCTVCSRDPEEAEQRWVASRPR